MNGTQLAMFTMDERARHPKRFVRTTYTDERELINDIMWLYNGGRPFDVDPCYSVGRFWQGLPLPLRRFDIAPSVAGVERADCQALPLAAESVHSVMFDPPFVTYPSSTSVITNRFSAFDTLADLQAMYRGALCEFARILEADGILVFKCQDLTHNHKQFLTHVFVVNEAEALGYTCHDLIVLVRDQVLLSAHVQAQEHARKTHSYFLVFSKGNRNPSLQWKDRA